MTSFCRAWSKQRLRTWRNFDSFSRMRVASSHGLRSSSWGRTSPSKWRDYAGLGRLSGCTTSTWSKTGLELWLQISIPFWMTLPCVMRRQRSGRDIIVAIHRKSIQPTLPSPGWLERCPNACCVCFRSGKCDPSSSSSTPPTRRGSWAITSSRRTMRTMMLHLEIGRHTWTSCWHFSWHTLWQVLRLSWWYQGAQHCLISWGPTPVLQWRYHWMWWWLTTSAQSALRVSCQWQSGSHGCNREIWKSVQNGWPSSENPRWP